MTDRNRNEPPGLRIVRGHAMPPFFTDHHIESMAVHSRSKGWIPGINIEMNTVDGAGIVGVFTADDALEFVEVILTAVERAEQDYTAAVMDGYKPERNS